MLHERKNPENNINKGHHSRAATLSSVFSEVLVNVTIVTGCGKLTLNVVLAKDFIRLGEDAC